MKKTLLLLLVAMMLVGCATGHWTKPNFKDEEWRKDYYECDYNANMYCYRTSGAYFALCYRDNISRCLKARGYEYVKEGSSGSPDNVKAGLAAENRGDYDEAVRLYTKAIESGDLSRDQLSIVYRLRGILWWVKGDNDRAITDLTKAIELNPQEARAYYFRGATWGSKGDLDRAIADFTKVIELNPQYTGTYIVRGELWMIKGNYDRAISDYTKAIELDPKEVSGYNGLAWCLAVCPESKFRDGVKAVKLAQKAVELKESSNNLDTLAAAYAEAGIFQDAIKTEERAIAKLKEEGNTKDIPELEEHLAFYKAGKPWRQK